ncbi:uncharacterized protein BDW70DRAFT_134729 [Aspergillus foveolatus]|uniref:uncharacterized protein n=1 Tax=Aspergillus foveolatus TaxID=210207 RepID=UPI003CCD2BE8
MARSVALSCGGSSSGSTACVVIGSPTTDGTPIAGASSPICSPSFSVTCASACAGSSLISFTGLSRAGVIASVCSTSGSGISGVCLSSWAGASNNFFSPSNSEACVSGSGTSDASDWCFFFLSFSVFLCTSVTGAASEAAWSSGRAPSASAGSSTSRDVSSTGS